MVGMVVCGAIRPVGMEISFAYLLAASLRESIRPRIRDLVNAFGAFRYPEYYYFLTEWAEERAGWLVIWWLKFSRCCWSRW